jgi:hypothetical protein
MIAFKEMARRHWRKNLPGLVRELKKAGAYRVKG